MLSLMGMVEIVEDGRSLVEGDHEVMGGMDMVLGRWSERDESVKSCQTDRHNGEP